MTLSVVRSLGGKLTTATWSAETTAGNSSIGAYQTDSAALVATIHVRGTFGGATVTFLGSIDGTNFIAMDDNQGDAISVTAAGYAEISTGFPYMKPNIAGGTGDSLTVAMAHWTA